MRLSACLWAASWRKSNALERAMRYVFSALFLWVKLLWRSSCCAESVRVLLSAQTYPWNLLTTSFPAHEACISTIRKDLCMRSTLIHNTIQYTRNFGSFTHHYHTRSSSWSEKMQPANPRGIGLFLYHSHAVAQLPSLSAPLNFD